MTELHSSDERFIRNITDIILANLENPDFGVNELAVKSGMSHYSLSRKLHSINRKTVNQFIREVRLKKAFEIIQNEDITASEAAYRTGFGSPVYFNKCFREFYGYPPGKTKKGDQNNWESEVVNQSISENVKKKKTWNMVLVLPVTALLFIGVVVIGYNIFRKISPAAENKPDISSGQRVSIAVMPFRNLTNDSTLDIWREGFQQNMIASLSNCNELKVRQRESVNTLVRTEEVRLSSLYSETIADNVSRKLNADIFIYGSMQKDGPRIRIDAQLIETGSGEVMKAFEVTGSSREETFFYLIDTLRKKVTDFLLLSKIIKENPVYATGKLSTSSPEAFRYYLNGDKDYENGNLQAAISWYLKALALDSNFFEPMVKLSSAYYATGNQEQNYSWVLKYYNRRNQWSVNRQIEANWAYAINFEAPEEAIKYLVQAEQVDDQDPSISFQLGHAYMNINQYEDAIPELEKHLALCKRWGEDFLNNNWAYFLLGKAYDKTGQLRKEKKLYREAEHYIPVTWLATRKALLCFTEKDTAGAMSYINKYITARKNNSASEADIASGVGDIYYQAMMFDEAEEYYSRALDLDQNNTGRILTLVNFNIDTGRSLGKVPDLMDKVINQAPNKCEYYSYLDLKGWAYYKLGNYMDALNILQDVWDNAPFKLYKFKFHLDEVKKALTAQS